MADKNKFLSLPQAAILLGISRIAVFKQVKKGRLAAIRIGRNWAVPADALKNPQPEAIAPLKALGTTSVPAPRISTGPAKERSKPSPAVPETPAPQNDFLDDLGWD